MKKLLIYLILPLLVLCSIIKPTYCVTNPPPETYEITLTKDFNKGTNFYNNNNLQYVFIDSIELSRPNGLIMYSIINENKDYFNSLNNTHYYTTRDLVCYSPNGNIVIGTISIAFRFTFNSETNVFMIIQDSYSINYNDFKIPLTNTTEDFRSIYLSVINIPLNVIKPYLSNGLIGVNFYRWWSIKFHINYNNQYFYNNYFGINYFNQYPLKMLQANGFTDINRTIKLYDNNNYVFIKNINTFSEMLLEGILLNNKFNYNNSYIEYIEDNYNVKQQFVGRIENNLLEDFYFNHNFFFSTSASEYVEDDTSYTLYSSNSLGQDNLSSPLIPNGSNDFYKTGEWWDIPTHLYNFFIYLIFDAPIISNFTSLVMIIINFIVEVFEFFIGLFDGIGNVFFISIFIGFIVLIFLLKIIFKG